MLQESSWVHTDGQEQQGAGHRIQWRPAGIPALHRFPLSGSVVAEWTRLGSVRSDARGTECCLAMFGRDEDRDCLLHNSPVHILPEAAPEHVSEEDSVLGGLPSPGIEAEVDSCGEDLAAHAWRGGRALGSDDAFGVSGTLGFSWCDRGHYYGFGSVKSICADDRESLIAMAKLEAVMEDCIGYDTFRAYLTVDGEIIDIMFRGCDNA